MCKISVITICKNEAKYIKKTIESVLIQNYMDFEYIIVDGKSSDGTFEIVDTLMQRDKRIRMISETDSGIYDAMNKGIELAKGDYIYFLNVKDYLYDKDVFAKVAEYMNGGQNDIIIGSVIRERWCGRTIEGVNSYSELIEQIKEGMCVCHQAIFAKRGCLAKGFDLSYKMAADYDWLCRQIVEEKQIKIANAIIASYDMYGMSGNAKYRKTSVREWNRIQKIYFGIDIDYKRKIQFMNKCMINEVMTGWLILKQRGISIADILEKKGIRSVAIYGMHTLGVCLAEELEESSIDVKYGIDRKCLFRNLKLSVVKPDDRLEDVDALIITPMMDYYEIITSLKEKIDCQFVSLEDLIGAGFENT